MLVVNNETIYSQVTIDSPEYKMLSSINAISTVGHNNIGTVAMLVKCSA